jgi:cystathionine beta-synthase
MTPTTAPPRPIPAVAESVLDTIGATPMVRLSRFGRSLLPELLAKVEYFNPGGSTKDRVAVAMIRDAERTGDLQPGGTIIEATAGNTGLGLALAAAVLGYRCIFVMPDKMSADKVNLLKAYGAEVVITPTAVPPDSPESYNGVASRLAREIKGGWRPNQFANQANPRVHYEITGPEIWEQTGGTLTHFVAGAGTGGSLSGIGQYLKERNPAIRVIGADIEGSILSGDSPKPWKVEGIGEDFVPSTLNARVVDEWIRVTDEESFLTAREVARTEGLLLGGSCGTALAAAVKLAARLGAGDRIVVFTPDTGRNYVSKFYNDQWMEDNGFPLKAQEKHTIQEVLAKLGGEDRELHALKTTDTVQRAIDMLREHGFSQFPVVEDGRMVGSVEEITLMKYTKEHRGSGSATVGELMAKSMPQLDISTVVDEAYRLLLAGHPAVVVTRGTAGKPAAILTRSDLVHFWESL